MALVSSSVKDVVVRDVSRESRFNRFAGNVDVVSDGEMFVDSRESLKAKGYVETYNADSGEFVYKSPSEEFISYQDKKLKEKSSYSSDVVVTDSSGRVLREEKYSPGLVEAYGSTVIREAKLVEKNVYDYNKGEKTTETFDPTNRNTILASSQIVEGQIARGERTSEPIVVTRRREAEQINNKIREQNQGYKRFQTTNNKVGAVSGDVQVFQGSKAQREKYVSDPIYARGYNTMLRVKDATRRSEALNTQGFDKANKIFISTPKKSVVDLKGQSIDYEVRANIPFKERAEYKAERYLEQQQNKVDVFKEPILFGKEIVKGFSKPVISFGKGNIKLLSSVSGNPFIDESLRNKNVKDLITSDKDIKVAVGGDIVLAGAVASPIVATGLGIYGGFLGFKSLKEGFIESNPTKIGSGGFDIAGSGLFSLNFKRPFVEMFGKKVVAEEVFGGEIGGRSVKSTSTKEALEQFEVGRLETGDIEVITVSPSFLKGGNKVEVLAGPKGKAGIEDPVLYVGPKTRANVMFTGLERKGVSDIFDSQFGELSFDLLNIKSEATVSTIRVKDVVVPSAKLTNEPGYIKASEFYKGKGVAFITKRSMIGKGELPRQEFSVLEDVQMRTLSYKKGQRVVEKGTGESEAGIPSGSLLLKEPSFSLSERFSFTVINQKKIFGYDIPLTGDLIRLPKYKLLKDKNLDVEFIKGKKDIVDFKDVVKSDISSLKGSGSRKINIFNSIVIAYDASVKASERVLSSKDSLIFRDYSSGNVSSPSSIRKFSSSIPISDFSFGSSVPSLFNSSSSSSRGSSKISFSSFTSSKISSKGSLSSAFSDSYGGVSSKRKSNLSISSSSGVPVYDVVVRETRPKKGKAGKSTIREYKVANDVPYNQANAEGSYYADNSSARSWRLVAQGKRKNIDDSPEASNLFKFRPNKTSGNLRPKYFVEKNEYLIDTEGERQEISVKGLLANRRKNNLFGGVF